MLSQSQKLSVCVCERESVWDGEKDSLDFCRIFAASMSIKRSYVKRATLEINLERFITFLCIAPHTEELNIESTV